jgi:NodT family efflux transporter outer membrane factor (OMF) lipoprotein
MNPATLPRTRRLALRTCGISAVALLSACAVGPNYRRPATPAPVAFKEAAGWKPAAPADAVERGNWWLVYNDPVLSDLEERAARANQSLLQAAANYEQARQLARADRATLFPTLSASGSAQRSHSGGSRSGGTSTALGSSTSGGGSGTSTGTSSGTGTGTTVAVSPSSNGITTNYSGSVGASWSLDFWGRVRRLTESDVAAAQASAADLANARLSIQATLAQTYLQLRIADERIRLRQTAVDALARTLTIAQNKYRVGIVARNDVASAQAQVDAARAQRIDAGIQRAQLEHALAVLIGVAPGEFSLPADSDLHVIVPTIPPQLPSELLERRPDIAAAERNVAAANARVGVQTAAYFPQVTLSGDVGYASSAIDQLFRTPNRFWSLGANLGETLFDFGRRRAQVAAARAAYDGEVAAYRGAVLRGFQQVEDDLVSLRLLETEGQVQDAAVTEAAEAARIAMNEYQAGTADFTTVATAQINEINARQNSLTVLQNRLNSSVALIEALGGGWRAGELPNRSAVLARSPSTR